MFCHYASIRTLYNVQSASFTWSGSHPEEHFRDDAEYLK